MFLQWDEPLIGWPEQAAIARRYALGAADCYRAALEAKAAEPITAGQAQILRGEVATVSDMENAYGGYALDVAVLERRGMLRYVERIGGDDWATAARRYVITSLGRDELERQRVADLAAIGVHEISAEH